MTSINSTTFSLGTYNSEDVAQRAFDAANEVLKKASATEDIELLKERARRAATTASGIHAAVIITTKNGDLLAGFKQLSVLPDKACGVSRGVVRGALQKKSGQVGSTIFYARKGKAGDFIGLTKRGKQLLCCDELGKDIT
jgi:hypothetical protein